MRQVLLIAGAALICAGPALADDVTIEKRTTVTKEVTTEKPESGSTVSTVVIAPNPPPPPRAEVRPPPPGPEVVWMDGHWSWEPGEKTYVWLPGKYAEPPRPRAAWMPGHWDKRPDGWVWVGGRWQ